MYRLVIDPVLKKAMIFFCVVFISMISMVYVSDMYKTSASKENDKVFVEMRTWSNRIEEANRNNQILVQHEDTFKQLKERSVIGDENRLSWVEVVQNVADSRGIASVKYDIASQVLMDKNGMDKKYAGIDVYRSVMNLEMKFIHEGDLFVMLKALKNEAKGLVTVDKCEVELINKDVNEGVIGEDATDNMRAYCELSWYTLKKAGQT
jgi:hypothetical protein